MKDKDIKVTFEKVSKNIEDVNKIIEGLLPQAIVKKTTSFGNSSHVVLPKSFVDKRVGVVILGKEVKNV